ncbi:MAG: hypothetical protein D6160_13905 [Ketobacter sp.]|nr:MAG: hypothetical protein D6160_13905 [Ketobacter sp.]
MEVNIRNGTEPLFTNNFVETDLVLKKLQSTVSPIPGVTTKIIIGLNAPLINFLRIYFCGGCVTLKPYK